MGQRHQLFVIAKVKDRYRTLCAVHHQWLYGRTALRRCLGTLETFQDPTNRVPIQQELVAASKHDEDFWVYEGHKEYYGKNNHVPFPFIATCLVLGASYSPEGYFHAVSIEPFFMTYNQGDNNDGITIFDITEPSSVRYCFADFHGMESRREVPLMTPLSARTYLDAYYDLDEQAKGPKDLASLVESLDHWRLTTTAALEDTWPGEGWEDEEVEDEAEQVKAAQRDDRESAEPTADLEGLSITSMDTTSTLRDRAMDTLLQSLLNQPDDSSHLIAEAELLTDFLPKMKAKFYDQASGLKPSAYLLDMICRTLENDAEVDLSPFLTLSVHDLSHIVSKLQKHGKMNLLNLSNRPDIGENDLHVIVGQNTTLRALCLLEMPQISTQSLADYLSHWEVYHSDIFRSPLDGDFYHVNEEPLPAPPISGSDTITQIQWLGLSYMDSMDEKLRFDDSRIAWDALNFTTKRCRFGPSRGELDYKKCGLDIPLPAGKMVQGFLRLLQWGASANTSSSSSEQWFKGVACSLAASPPRNSSGTGHGISLLSPKLWNVEHNSEPEEVSTAWEHGQWALVVFSEAYNAESQEYLDGMWEDRYPTANPSATDSNPEPSSADTKPKKPEGSEAPMNIEALLFGDINQMHFPKKDNAEESSSAKHHPSWRPRKAIRYAFVTPIAGSKTALSVADMPTCLTKLLGDTAEAKGLIDLWKDRIATLGNVEYFGDAEDFDNFLQKIYPPKAGDTA